MNMTGDAANRNRQKAGKHVDAYPPFRIKKTRPKACLILCNSNRIDARSILLIEQQGVCAGDKKSPARSINPPAGDSDSVRNLSPDQKKTRPKACLILIW